MIARVLTLLAVIAAFAWPDTLKAQDIDRVTAVVNDDVISLKELSARIRLSLVFSNLADTQDNRGRVSPQVLRKMVDERLQMQEASRLKISISSADLDGSIAMLEQQNGLPKGGLIGNLSRAGVQPDVIRDQIRADMTWNRVVARVLTSQVRISDDEINDRLDNIKARQGKPEYLTFEIFLPVDNPAQEDDIRKLGENLIEQVRAGAPFSALARQFSRAPSASQGGNLGWIYQGGADDDLVAGVANLPKGGVSSLLRTPGGFTILSMAGQRIAGQTINTEETVVTLTYITLPILPGAPPKPQLMASAENLTSSAKSCPDLESIGRKAGSSKYATIGPMRVGELPPDLRRIGAVLPAGRVSDPQDTQDGIRVSMVCSRQETGVMSLPSREQIRRQIEDERLDMLARRYLRNLRRAAVIDIRG